MGGSATIDIPADGVVNDALTVYFPENISQVHFIKLRLLDEKGKEVSSNFYWRSNDEYKGRKTLTGPAASGFESLKDLKQAKLQTSYKVRKSDNNYYIDIKLKNVSGTIAFFNQLQFLDQQLQPIRPSFYTDNFFSLLPGESKKVTIETSESNIKDIPVLVVRGWNVPRKEFVLKR